MLAQNHVSSSFVIMVPEFGAESTSDILNLDREIIINRIYIKDLKLSLH